MTDGKFPGGQERLAALKSKPLIDLTPDEIEHLNQDPEWRSLWYPAEGKQSVSTQDNDQTAYATHDTQLQVSNSTSNGGNSVSSNASQAGNKQPTEASARRAILERDERGRIRKTLGGPPGPKPLVSKKRERQILRARAEAAVGASQTSDEPLAPRAFLQSILDNAAKSDLERVNAAKLLASLEIRQAAPIQDEPIIWERLTKAQREQARDALKTLSELRELSRR